MSLKGVHICFILLSTALAFGFGYWGIRDYSNSGKVMNLCLGIGSLVGGGALVYYLFRFIQKMKKINPLYLLPILICSPQTAWSCSVCFGDPDSGLSKGVLAGVLLLMGVVGSVLSAIAVTIFVWIQRAKKPSSPERGEPLTRLSTLVKLRTLFGGGGHL